MAKLKTAQRNSQIDPSEHAALQSELDATQAKLAEAVKAAKAANAETEKVKKSELEEVVSTMISKALAKDQNADETNPDAPLS